MCDFPSFSPFVWVWAFTFMENWCLLWICPFGAYFYCEGEIITIKLSFPLVCVYTPQFWLSFRLRIWLALWPFIVILRWHCRPRNWLVQSNFFTVTVKCTRSNTFFSSSVKRLYSSSSVSFRNIIDINFECWNKSYNTCR